MGLWLGIGVMALDQLTKKYVVNNVAYRASLPIIDSILNVTYVKNSGSAFGLFPEHTRLFIIGTIILVLILITYLRDLIRESMKVYIGLALGVGGALGNLMDRMRLGYVVDFIDIHIWPIFNVADVAILIGSALIFIGAISHNSGGERGDEE